VETAQHGKKGSWVFLPDVSDQALASGGGATAPTSEDGVKDVVEKLQAFTVDSRTRTHEYEHEPSSQDLWELQAAAFMKFGYDMDDREHCLLEAIMLLGREPSITFKPRPTKVIAKYGVEYNHLTYEVTLSRSTTGEFNIESVGNVREVIPAYDPYHGLNSLALAKLVHQKCGYECQHLQHNSRETLVAHAMINGIPGARGTRGGLDGTLNGANGEVTGKDDVPKRGEPAKKKAVVHRSVPGYDSPVQPRKQAQPPKQASGKAVKKMVNSALSSIISSGSGVLGSAIAGSMGVPGAGAMISKGLEYGGKYAMGLKGAGAIHPSALGAHNYNKVKVNSLIKGGMSPNASYGDGRIRIRHREKICNIESNLTTPGSTLILPFTVQPGDINLFRKTGVIAQNYAKYHLRGACIEFVSACSELSTTSTMPIISIGCQSNVTSAAPVTIEGFEALDGVVSSSMDKSIGYGLECDGKDDLRKTYLIRNANTPTTANAIDYDYCTVYVGIETPTAVSADAMLGKLYMTWDIELDCPTTVTYRPGYCRILRNGGTGAAPLGTSTTTYFASGALTGVTVTSTTITFPKLAENTSVYVMIDNYGSVAATITYPVVNSASGFTGLNLLNGAQFSSTYTPTQSTSATAVRQSFTLASTYGVNGTPTITFGTAGTLPATPLTTDIQIFILGVGLQVGVNC